MIALIALSAILVIGSGNSFVAAQYPYQGHNQGYSQQQQPAPQSYQPQQQAHQPQPQSYQPQPQAQSYQPQSQQSPRSYAPAAVHYVNIGKDLAGDYKFGYDTGKGNDGQSFREETRLPDGTVQGAYGYVDGSGQQRIIKYTAGKNGFQVEGDGIPKAPAAPAPAPAPAQAQQPQQAYNYGASGQSYNSRGY